MKEVTLCFRGQNPKLDRGSIVVFGMPFYTRTSNRKLADVGDEAIVVSDVDDNNTVSVQPRYKHYPIHNCPIEILLPSQRTTTTPVTHDL